MLQLNVAYYFSMTALRHTFGFTNSDLPQSVVNSEKCFSMARQSFGETFGVSCSKRGPLFLVSLFKSLLIFNSVTFL